MRKGTALILGVTGSVAAYKSVDLVRRLRDEDASVEVIMTEAAQRFITPLSFHLASGNNVFTDMWESPLAHIALTAKKDLFLIAPATANLIGKYAHGIADDLLTTALLAYHGAVLIAPAMNVRMWENAVVQSNIGMLAERGVRVVGPARGTLACGVEGVGRMAEVEAIIDAVETVLSPQDLSLERVLVTAGPTREPLDPVRYLSNRSSGKMGYALATVARRRGAEVTLISGPVSLQPPEGVRLVRVETAADMHRAVAASLSGATVVIMSAAVADYTPTEPSAHKREKTEHYTPRLVRTVDILGEIGQLAERPFTVGFAAETGSRLQRAREKLAMKQCDMIVFNDVLRQGSGFEVDTNEVVIIDGKAETKLPLMSKEDVASAILDRLVALKHGSNSPAGEGQGHESRAGGV
jgi:phosphopantothenoylcysteine decarboxylase/phosphopantothenate--cysteine ligase